MSKEVLIFTFAQERFGYKKIKNSKIPLDKSARGVIIKSKVKESQSQK